MLDNIAFNQLFVSPNNVRTLSPEKQADKQLIAGIRAEGLLQNLVVVRNGKKFEVIAGGRRYQAIAQLVQEGHYKPSDLFPCLEKKDNVTAVSAMENLQRAALEPTDEFRAYSAMVREGKPIKDIATMFGVSQKQVQQRMALGTVSPVLLKLFEAEKIDLDDLMAFTVSDDHEKQEACYASMKANFISPARIRAYLTGEAVTSKSAIAKFVGLAAYKKAGGATVGDLFEDTVYLSDTLLIETMANEQLAQIANKIKTEEGWQWVTAGMRLTTNGLVSIAPTPRKPPKELAAQVKALEAELAALEDAFYDRPEEAEPLTPKEVEKMQNDSAAKEALLETLTTQLDEASHTYSAKQKAYSGAVVTLNSEGVLVIHRGYAHPADVKAEAPTKASKTTQGQNEQASTDLSPMSQTLVADLGAYRQEATKAMLLQHDHTALDVLRYSFCAQILYQGHDNSYLLELHARVVRSTSSMEDAEHGKASDELNAALATLSTAWLAGDSPADRFQRFVALTEEQKTALTTYAVAHSLHIAPKGQNAAQDVLVAMLAVPFAQYWRPTKENYFSRISKPVMAEQFAGLRGAAWADSLAKAKKADAVDELTTWINQAPDWLPDTF